MKIEYTDLLEIEVLKKQNVNTLLFIITLLVSLYLTYNEQLRLAKKTTITSLKFDQAANLLNRIVGVLILISIVYVSYLDYKVAKIKNDEISLFEKEIIASILNLASGVIILLVVIEALKSDSETVSLENPIT